MGAVRRGCVDSHTSGRGWTGSHSRAVDRSTPRVYLAKEVPQQSKGHRVLVAAHD